MRVKFAPGQGFHQELKRRVDEYFQRTGCARRDNPSMYLKAAVLLAWMGGTYGLLVFRATAWRHALPLSIALGLALAGIGFNLQHDGGHGAFSARTVINRVMASMLDLLGGSSYVCHWKHNVFHHTYPNITGADDDLDGRPFLRLSPHQTRYRAHRFQHLYIWLLYGLLPIKWQLVDDVRNLVTGRIGAHRFPRPRGSALLALVVGKVLFLAWALGVPLLVHSVGVVLLFFFTTSFTLGVTLSLVFQLAHCVEEADFPPPLEGAERTEFDWAIHQIRSTVDFGRNSRLLTWYLGGLNFQIEHHLFPRIAHVHYPALAGIVETACS